MDQLQAFVDALDRYGKLFLAPEQEPDPARYRDPDKKLAASMQLDSFKKELVDVMPVVLESVREDDHSGLKADLIDVTLSAAGFLIAVDAGVRATELLTAVAKYAQTGMLKELIEARSELDSIRLAVHARWKFRNKDFKGGWKLAKQLASQAKAPVFKKLSATLIDTPQPIKSAPTLYTLNGIGTTMYGRRDPQPDGSYVATVFLCLVFIPLIPLSSYRVLPQGQGWLFYGKVPLSGFARAVKLAMLSFFLFGAAMIGVGSYLGSSSYRAREALAEAQQLEKSGKSEDATRAYGRLLTDFVGTEEYTEIAAAAEGLVRLRLPELPDPMTQTAAERAAALVQRLETLPAGCCVRAVGLLVTALQERAQKLAANPEASALAVRLHELTLKIATGEQKERSQSALLKLRRANAERLAKDWPVNAAHEYMAIGESADVAAAVPLFQILIKEPLLLFQERAVTKQFMSKARGSHGELVAQIEKALADAEKVEEDKARQEVLASGKPAELAALLSRNRWDQEAAMALAGAQIRQGKVDAGWQQLSTIAPPGLLVREAQRLVATVAMERGELKTADTILTSYIRLRLPGFQAARQKFMARDKALREQLIAQGRTGTLPTDLEARLKAASEEDQTKIFAEWLSQQLSADKELSAALDDYRGFADVVSASVTMGTLKLREAQSAEGPARAALLRDAEQTFLSIGSEAEGTPEYHLGLGQVLHRLGKATEGDAEFRRILDGKNYAEHIAVARAYRELGLIKRGQQVAEAAFKEGDKEVKDEAAIQLSLMAHVPEEREAWLRKASSTIPFVRKSLLQLEADRLARQGKLKLADAKYAQVVEEYRSSIKTNPSSANNAALVLQSRYTCTGDPKFLAEAVQTLELGLRQHADNSLLIANLADLLQTDANIRVLGRYVHLKDLLLTSNDATVLVARLGTGPHRAQLREALSSDVAMRRSMDLFAQLEVLAPGSLEPFDEQLSWLRLHGNTAGLKSLLARAERVQSFDTAAYDETRTSYVEGKSDPMFTEMLSASRDRWKETLARVVKTGHKPTEAAVRMLLAHAERTLFNLTRDPALAHESLAEVRRAAAAWNGFDLRPYESEMLLDVAVAEMTEKTPGTGKTIGTLARTYSPAALMFVLERDHAEIYKALKQSPRLPEAAQIWKGVAPEDLSDAAYSLGKLAGDAELQAAGKKYWQGELPRLALKLHSILYRNSKDNKATADMVAALGL